MARLLAPHKRPRTVRLVEAGKLIGVRVPLKGKALPAKARVHLLVDTYPASTATLGAGG